MSDGTFRQKKGFTACPNAVVEDRRLDMATVGLYCMIQSKVTIPNSKWNKSFFMNWALENPKNSKNGFNDSWRKLKDCGYLKIYIYSTGKGTWREYDLLDSPEEGPSEIRISSKKENEMLQSTENREDFQGAKNQHLGNPAVGNPMVGNPAVGNPDVGKPTVGISEVGISNTKDINKTELLNNNNLINKTEFKFISPVSHNSKDNGQDRQEIKQAYVELIKDQVNYDSLVEEHENEKEIIDGIINVITDIATTKSKSGYERINGRDDYPYEVVKSRLLKTDARVMEHVLEKLNQNTCKIHNLRAYLLTVLYNAKDEMELSIMNQVNYDMYGGGWEEKGIV